MILDLSRLKRKGKTEEEFFFEYYPENFSLSLPDSEIVMPVKTEGRITLTGERSALIEGEVVFTVKGNCTRCLKETEKVFAIEFSEVCDEEAEGAYKVINDRINLVPIVEEIITLNTPVSFLCKEDCKGICQKCGADLNEGDCNCIKEGK